jgi:hypothetical protein
MHKSKLSIGGLLAAGLTCLLAADASVASAQTPSPPTAEVEAKAETRPGPLDMVIYFRASGSDIDTASNSSLDELAVWLREDRSRAVFIEGHPQESAAAGFDVKLGGERIDATRRYLVAHGAMDSQIRVVAHGQVSTAKAGDLNTRTIFVAGNSGKEVAMGGEGEMGAGAGAPGGQAGGYTGMDEEAGTPTSNTTSLGADVPAEPLPPEPVATDSKNDHLATPFGMAIAVGGGVVGFFDSDTRGFTDTGGTWEARLTMGTRTPLAVEAAYVGSAQNVDALGLDSSAILLGSSFEADARLNFTTSAVQPYLFGGIGYTRYDVTNSDTNTSSINDKEEMGHIPVGAGLGWQYGGLLLDLRGTLRAAFDDGLHTTGEDHDEILPDDEETPQRAELDNWNVTGRVGFEF